MINRTKLEHILEYARQQRRFGQHCKIPPGDMVEIVEIAMRKAGNSPVTPDGWISCSERMPEDTKMLLAFSQGKIVAAYWNWVMSPIDYKKYRAFKYLSGNILDDVTHWMPMLEPPEQDGE
ncbi:TPA: DUF551 domain-containing protein [Escherichia coli]|nr:DUF551 domain-containing protein [Escherichia coli]HAJ6687077.1 DUF551 domain-containing protein [Escherichia coli]